MLIKMKLKKIKKITVANLQKAKDKNIYTFCEDCCWTESEDFTLKLEKI